MCSSNIFDSVSTSNYRTPGYKKNRFIYILEILNTDSLPAGFTSISLLNV